MQVRVEAAAYRGQPVYFKITGPWTPPPLAAPASPATTRRFWQVAANILGTLLLAAILLLARSNLRAGRGDRRGAARIFFFTLAVWFAAWLVGARHYSTFAIEDDRFFEFLAHALLNTAIAWLLYLALEPYVRRFSPGILISWTRVLSGQIVDPRVGRDILIGVAVGVARGLAGRVVRLVLAMAARPPPDAARHEPAVPPRRAERRRRPAQDDSERAAERDVRGRRVRLRPRALQETSGRRLAAGCAA